MNKIYSYLASFATFIIIFLACTFSNAATYYFSSSLGDDTRSSAQAQNEYTPWKSIQKLNSIFNTLQPGDNILFKSGETFHGTIHITKSGNGGTPISFGNYGYGEKPVLTGFREIKDWVSKGGNVYEAHIPEVTTSVSTVVINNVLQPMGRYPNDNANNSGYLTIDSYNNGTVGSSGLQAPANMTGGEIVIRKNNWIIDRHLINWQGGSSVNYNTAGSSYNPEVGYGFFIQNHAATLDKHGEWYFDKATRKLLIFYLGDPWGANIRVSTVDRVINTQNSASNIKISNLAIQGSNENLINLDKSSNFTIENCQLDYAGRNAINTVLSRNLILSNSRIENALNGGIRLGWDDRGTIVKNSTISKILNFAGMGQSSDNQGDGIFMSETTSDVLIEYSAFLECGSNAVFFKGNNITIKNNLIDTFCFVKDDGGGIYTFTGDGYTNNTNRKILNNIIVNGIGAVPGTKPFGITDLPYVEGIYLDRYSNGMEVDGNTIANVKSKGIFLNNCRNVSLTNNKIYNTGFSVFFTNDHPENPARNITMKNNQFLNKTSDQVNLYFRSKENYFAQVGVLDNNVYSKPVDESRVIRLQTPGKNGQIDLQAWKDGYGFDKLSTQSPVAHDKNKMELEEFILFDYNFSSSPKSIPLSGTYVDLKGIVLSGSVTVPPYSSVLLLKTEVGAPVQNIPPTVNITGPTSNAQFALGDNINITSVAADSDGTITKVDFYQGNTLLGTDTASPYSFVWVNLPLGTFSLTARATDNNGTTTVSDLVSINVGEKTSRSPFGGTAATIPGTVEAENYDIGGQGLTYYDVDAGNKGGVYRADDVDINAAVEGGHTVGWMNLGEWLEYTVNITTAGAYNLDVRVASPGNGGTFHIECNGVDVTGPLTVPATGGWDTWASVTKTGVNLPAGRHLLRYVLDSYGVNEYWGNLNSMIFTLPNGPAGTNGGTGLLEGLVAFYEMNTNSSGVLRDSHGQNHGISTNIKHVDGFLEKGNEYNGSSSISSVPHSKGLELTTEFSIMADIFREGDGQYYGSNIIGKTLSTQWSANHSYSIALTSENKIRITTNNPTIQEWVSTQTVPLNKWIRIIATYKSGEGYSLYFDTVVPEKSQIISGTIYNTVSELAIGAASSQDDAAQSRRFYGILDNVGIWNRKLLPDEIAKLINTKITYPDFKGNEAYRITITSTTEESSGKITPTKGSTKAEAGEKLMFFIEEEEGVVFDHWSIDGVQAGNQNLIELEMPEKDITLTKHFRTFVAPEIKIVLPGQQSEFEALTEVHIEFETKSNDGIIEKVELFNGEELVGELTQDSTGFEWKKIPEGNHQLVARITDANGKTYFSDPVMLNAVDSQSKDISNILLDFEIGPNPTTNYLNVIFRNLDGVYDLEFKVVAMNGSVQKTFHARPETSIITIDVSDLQTGSYILHLMANGKNLSSKKFIKRK